jgi:hypothetical protein
VHRKHDRSIETKLAALDSDAADATLEPR